MTEAALLFLRSDMLRGVSFSVADAIRFLMDFVEHNLRVLDVNGIFSHLSADCTLAQFSGAASVEALAGLLADHVSAALPSCLYLAPCARIPCVDPVLSNDGYWLPSSYDLRSLAKSLGIREAEILNEQFPPAKWAGRGSALTKRDSWIGCMARSDLSADSQLRRIVGALFMALEPRHSLAITGGDLIHGSVRIHPSGDLIIRGVASPVPPLAPSVRVTDGMSRFVRSILDQVTSTARLGVALDYAAAAWSPTERHRFLHVAVALDALFGSDSGVRASIQAGVCKYAASITRIEDRVRLLYDMRNEVLHGEVGDLTGSSKYLPYFEKFGEDPARDQFTILRECMWEVSRHGLR